MSIENKSLTINKDKVAKSFLQSKDTYDNNAIVQNDTSRRLVAMLGENKQDSYDNVLEVGCCTGGLTKLLCESKSIKKLYLNDLAKDFYPVVRDRIDSASCSNIVPLFGDIEELDLPKNLDLIISGSTFQWLNSMERFLQRACSSLARNGLLVFSVFGPGTLLEFRKLTGIGLDYITFEDIILMLEKNYIIEQKKINKDLLFFQNTREILRHLKNTGVGGIGESGDKFLWTKSKLSRFEQKYSEYYGSSRGLPVTYTSYCFVARKR